MAKPAALQRKRWPAAAGPGIDLAARSFYLAIVSDWCECIDLAARSEQSHHSAWQAAASAAASAGSYTRRAAAAAAEQRPTEGRGAQVRRHMGSRQRSRRLRSACRHHSSKHRHYNRHCTPRCRHCSTHHRRCWHVLRACTVRALAAAGASLCRTQPRRAVAAAAPTVGRFEARASDRRSARRSARQDQRPKR